MAHFSRHGSETPFKAKITVGQGNPSPNYRHLTEERSRYVIDTDFYSNLLSKSKNDWALLELADEVPENLTNTKAVVPICLPTANEVIDMYDEVEMFGQGGIQSNQDGQAVGVETMRFIHTAIKETKVYGDPDAHIYLYHNFISLQDPVSRPGDSGGGITKASQFFINLDTGQGVFKKECR